MIAFPSAPGVASALRSRRSAKAPGLFVKGLLVASVAVTLAALAALVLTMLLDSREVLGNRLGYFLSHGFSQTGAANSGVWQGILGSIQIALIVSLVAFPVGVSAAVYLSEYARNTRLTRSIEVNIRNLAAVPSIVYGLLGLALFVQVLGDSGKGGLTGGRSVLSAGLTLSALVLPIVVITATEAIRAVPGSLREASYGLGATKWETVRTHVLPAALPGILTGTVLALARAIGEAAPLLVVGAVTSFFATGSAGVVEQLQGPFTALPMNIFSFARQSGSDWASNAAAASIVLLVLVLAVNAAAIVLRDRVERRSRGDL
ncbi:MAG: phosphate ABC transporter permease PstA [Acidimicrobiales bacterium]